MNLNVDMLQETTANDLPDKSEDEMFSSVCKVRGADIDHGAADGFGGCNDDIVVLGHLEVVEGLFGVWHVQDADINSVGHRVVDEFAQQKTVPALVKDLHVVCRYRKTAPNVLVTVQDLCWA